MSRHNVVSLHVQICVWFVHNSIDLQTPASYNMHGLYIALHHLLRLAPQHCTFPLYTHRKEAPNNVCQKLHDSIFISATSLINSLMRLAVSKIAVGDSTE